MKSLRYVTVSLFLFSAAFADPTLVESPLQEETTLLNTQAEALVLEDSEEDLAQLEQEILKSLEEIGVADGLEAIAAPVELEQEGLDDLIVAPPAEDNTPTLSANEDFELPIGEKDPSPTPISYEEPAAVVPKNTPESPALLQVDLLDAKEKTGVLAVNLKKAFAGSPVIYLILLVLSVSAVGIWLYSLLSLKQSTGTPDSFLKNLHNKLLLNQFDEALFLCNENENIFSKMVACGIQCRGGGRSSLVEAMRAEGKRSSIHFWQRIGLLNDIAIIAPMIGLLGTVLGMFYAFYDINRSIESITTLFDGLGVSVGTTVAGLVVAILALVLHSTAKYRLVHALSRVENEAHTFASLLNEKT